MKFTAVVLISATAVTAFTPSDPSCARVAALQGHALGGWSPPGAFSQARPAAAAAFTGFQRIADSSDPNPPSFNTATYQTTTAAAAAPQAAAAPAFSGFSHASGPMGANSSPFNECKPAASASYSFQNYKAVSSDPNPPFFNTATVQTTAAASAPPAAAAPAFSGFGHASGPMGANSSPFNECKPAEAAKPATPVFSGFGHAYELKDSNPPSFNTVGTAATAPPAASVPAFSGFGHATGPMGANSSPFNEAVAAAPAVTESAVPVFSGFGHAHSGQATSTRSYLERL